MKRFLVIVLLTLTTASLALAQKTDMLKEHLVSMEKKAWEAWKTHDVKFYEGFFAEEAVSIGAWGLEGKADFLKSIIETPCEVRSYSLDGFRWVRMSEDTAIVTYKAEQDATCGGEVVPAMVQATAAYKKQGDQWMSIFYQETPLQ